ncbi:hypothetical protein K450DRAFT_249913 [Umbelopsis ramanniana AG]|uniref:CWH43-like N-terminal domain-containing protein n=1 Tax=Umbelopsis ramanniana AG TaxID=1314678 RepID=A0AAD5E6C5_UMBRA|nr:uncharacterized protein K450DRAFT_249913 [Umbelopsis ramanniana AG]KAI8577928.1 hypothetical protein K450DRAFT_249913 [Umbelopsis ramanniana AG]
MIKSLKWLIFLPIFNFCCALALFLALLLLWVTAGEPKYKANESNIVYISDVGAVHKTLFIVIGTVIGVLYVVTLVLDYVLRRRKLLRPMERRKSEKPLAIAAIFFGFIACLGLILLTIFDAFNHSTLHWTFALIFFVGLAISGGFNVAMIALLHKDHPKSRLLKWSYRIKICIIVLAVICLICMIVLMSVCSKSSNKYDAQGNLSTSCNKEDSASAVFEWCIAFLFSFYLATNTLDLWPYRGANIIANELSTTMSQITQNA